MAKHRYGVSGFDAPETEKWGRETARARYGSIKYQDGAPAPKDQSQPQFRNDQAADKSYNDVSEKSWLRGGGKGGEGYPCYDRSRGKR